MRTFLVLGKSVLLLRENVEEIKETTIHCMAVQVIETYFRQNRQYFVLPLFNIRHRSGSGSHTQMRSGITIFVLMCFGVCLGVFWPLSRCVSVFVSVCFGVCLSVFRCLSQYAFLVFIYAGHGAFFDPEKCAAAQVFYDFFVQLGRGDEELHVVDLADEEFLSVEVEL